MAVPVRSRGVRVVRGLLVACLSVLVAAFSHVAGGGVAPGALGTTLALTFAILACIALSSRALSPVRLSISVALSQFVFHVLFSLGADLPAGAADHGSVGMLGMVMSGGHTQVLPDFGTPSGISAPAVSDARMWLGHACAALVTVALLLHGERAALTLVRLGGARLARLVVVVEALPASLGVARHGVITAVGDLRGLRPLEVLLVSRPHRGPPLGV
ncbi:hypothetical protein GCM10025867_03800 [Frondihabitans sucicola]|uniref:Uncharacterized protein n=1 Tax=Frondihabitans sucicola TaxID=1268041 RepID=A0ABM8GID4_9MICO|nr:hypothetical protein [Frondihabitans sucicola]BDZ48139.1 hypothetical protein GCM10025867_03800 [Frondihabitans sucicola]